MIHFQLGEQTTQGSKAQLPITVVLGAPTTSEPAVTNLTFTFTVDGQITEVRVTYNYTDPELQRVIEGGQTFNL
jgi:hypothetical protein